MALLQDLKSGRDIVDVQMIIWKELYLCVIDWILRKKRVLEKNGLRRHEQPYLYS